MGASKVWNETRRKKLASLGVLVVFLGLIASKFAVSVGMILILLAGLGTTHFKRDWSRLRRQSAYWVTTGIFGIVLLSGLQSSHLGHWSGLLKVVLPYLLLPLAFGLLPRFKQREVQNLLYIFIWMLTFSAVLVLVNYIINYNEIQIALERSKAIPTPQEDHIRYSLLLAIAIFAGGWLLQTRFYWRWQAEQYGLALALIFLWGMLHLLSVRSGLLAFYMGVLVLGVRLILVYKRYLLGLGLLGLLFLMPVLAYQLLPSVQTKVALMRYNWQEYQQGRIGDLSDTQRLLSYQVAIEVAQQSPIFGVGLGDLQEEQQRIYERDYPQQRVMFPHNQLLSFYTGTGLLGLMAFLFCFFYPLFKHQNYRQPFLLLFFTVMTSSFLTENTIFISVGIAMHLIFLMLFLNMQNENTAQVQRT